MEKPQRKREFMKGMRQVTSLIMLLPFKIHQDNRSVNLSWITVNNDYHARVGLIDDKNCTLKYFRCCYEFKVVTLASVRS